MFREQANSFREQATIFQTPKYLEYVKQLPSTYKDWSHGKKQVKERCTFCKEFFKNKFLQFVVDIIRL